VFSSHSRLHNWHLLLETESHVKTLNTECVVDCQKAGHKFLEKSHSINAYWYERSNSSFNWLL